MQQASRAWAIANNSIVDGGWGPEFLAFAMWAFSEDRLLDLRILAYGDFSKGERWEDQNVLLCRDESLPEKWGFNFRTLLDTDTYYWDLIGGNMDMLGPCPADTILYQYLGIVMPIGFNVRDSMINWTNR
jgi:hypothetical protein